MDTRQLVELVAERKAAWDEQHRFAHYECDSLLREWKEKRSLPGFTVAYYPIRAIAVFEVFIRTWVRVIVDYSTTFTERGIKIIQNVKPDYHLILSITARTITLGDIVAHTVSASSLGMVISAFDQLLGESIAPLLRTVCDRWATEILGEPQKPIISDYDATCSAVAKLFGMRHRICHEAPRLDDKEAETVGDLLQALSSLTHALEEVLTNEVFGLVPLTQTDMNLTAIRELHDAENEMEAVLEGLREKVKDYGRQLRLLDAAQRAWLRYRHLQSIFRHDPKGGGSIGPMVRAFEALELTRERTARLRVFLEAGEGWL